MSIPSTLGRLCVSLIFVLSGITKVHNYIQNEGRVETYIAAKMDEFVLTVDKLANQYGNYQIPTSSIQEFYPVIVASAGALEILGGLLFILNFHLGGYILLMLLLPFSFVVHNFWAVDDSQKLSESIHFFKNIAIFGGIYAYLNVRPPKFKTN